MSARGPETVVDALASAIVAEGIDLVTNLPDDVTIHIAQALREQGVRIVRPRHEQTAVVIADAYARATNNPAVAVIGPGPGIAQTGTGIMTSQRRRSPVLLVVAERGSIRGDGKAMDIRRFVESLGAQYVAVRGPATLAEDVREAFRLVRLRRGPVVLNLPDAGIFDAAAPSPWQYAPTKDVPVDGVEVDPASPAIDAAGGMLASSRRPVIVAGGGANTPEAARDIIELADRVGALLATSMQARGLFNGHPRYIGILGSLSTSGAAELVAEADCILALGISLNRHQTGGHQFGTATKLIQVDTEPTRIGQYATPEIAIVADAGSVVCALNRLLAEAEISAQASHWTSESARPRIEAAQFVHDPAPNPPPGANGPMPLSLALDRLDPVLPGNRVAIVDAGKYLPFVFDRISIPEPDAWVWSVDFISIGLGVGFGIGTALARPDRHCIAFVGDGGLSMSVQELETVVREQVPLTIVVLNDGAYSAEIGALGDKPKDLAIFRDVDFAAVFRAFGGDAVTFASLDDLPAVAERIANRNGALLVDVKVTEDEPHRLFRSGH